MYFDFQEPIENSLKRIDEILQYTKGTGTIIAVDSNARSTTWHDVLTNARGRNVEECLASKHLHVLNEDSERTTFMSSNVDLTIVNNQLLSAVNEWEISEQESCSDHSILKYIMGTVNTPTEKYRFQGKRYKITKDKFSEFDVNLAQNASKVFYNTNFKGNKRKLIITCHKDYYLNPI